MRIETDLDGKTVGAIERHYFHAREKHPYFCDMLNPRWMTPKQRSFKIAVTLSTLRQQIKKQVEKGCVMWDALLDCEVWEVHEAIECGQPEYAVEECYDAIAVLLRVIDVLEGRQQLGRPEERGDLCHEN